MKNLRQNHFQQSLNSQTALNNPVGWLEFNVPFQHKYGYIRDDTLNNAFNLESHNSHFYF